MRVEGGEEQPRSRSIESGLQKVELHHALVHASCDCSTGGNIVPN